MANTLSSSPKLYGLIMAGGKSQRMGENKALIAYHDTKPQILHQTQLLTPLTQDTYISISQQAGQYFDSYKTIADKYSNIGPMAGLLSAFELIDDVAWLSLACDLPYLETSHLEELINSRVANKLATSVLNPISKRPEPLITIWEPASYKILRDNFSKGQYSLMKILRSADIELVTLSSTRALTNCNTPEDKAEAVQYFNQQIQNKG